MQWEKIFLKSYGKHTVDEYESAQFTKFPIEPQLIITQYISGQLFLQKSIGANGRS